MSRSLVQAALEDLRAAEHLRSQLDHTNRQVLKLIDDAAELVMKATLIANGIDCDRKPFPWLLEQCKALLDLPEGVDSIHVLRNQVKHGGSPAPAPQVAKAFSTVLAMVNRLPLPTGVVYTYCVLCNSRMPMFRPAWKRTRRGTPVVAGWCFICNTKTVRMGGPPG